MYTAIHISVSGNNHGGITIMARGSIEDFAALSHGIVRDLWTKTTDDSRGPHVDLRTAFVSRLMHRLLYMHVPHWFFKDGDNVRCENDLWIEFGEEKMFAPKTPPVVMFDSDADNLTALCDRFDLSFVRHLGHSPDEVTVTLPADEQLPCM